MTQELHLWLDANKITYKVLDPEVVEVKDFGRLYIANLDAVDSIFKGDEANLRFNLSESPQTLLDEGICYVAFPFGSNWYFYDLREEFSFNLLKYIGQRQPYAHDIPFVNLGIHTSFELLNGSGAVSEWVRKAKYLGHGAIGICDRNTMAATLQLQKECEGAGIGYIFGYTFMLRHEQEALEVKVYSQTQQGLQNLLRIQKAVMVDSEDAALTLSELFRLGAGNVLVFGKLTSEWLTRNMEVVLQLKQHFAAIYYQVDASELKADRLDSKVLESLKCFFRNFHKNNTCHFEIEPILLCDNYYLDQSDAGNKVMLNKIASGAAHEQSDDQYYKDVDEHYATLRLLFGDDWDFEALFEQMCSNTISIANGAAARFETGKMFMPQYAMLPEETLKYTTRRAMFRALLDEGLRSKVTPKDRAAYRKRLDDEVYIIESTDNVDYFLIQWDMIREARNRGILTGIGRGSSGGSLVAYLLGITSVDPLQYKLLFSRFLVPERCGLQWVEQTTVVGEDVVVPAGAHYIELETEGYTYRLHPDAQLRVVRDGQEQTFYADELQLTDELLFDRCDELWTLQEIGL